MICDLHCHTKLSDGSLGIEDIIAQAKRVNIDWLSITDHDTMASFSRAGVLGERAGVKILRGVELSAWDKARNSKVHILLDHCNKINCPVILFTDLFATQEEMPSRLTFYCYRGEPNEYHSMTVPLLVLDLIILNLMQASKNSLTSSHYLEKLRAEYAQIIRR